VIGRWVWRAVLLVVLVLVVWFILIPQFAQVRPALHSLDQVSPPLLLTGLGLELGSIACYSALSRSTLNVSSRPTYFALLRIDVATEGVNNALPGGGPTSTALKIRLLTSAGATPANAVTGTTLEVSTSVLTLGGIFGVALGSVLFAFRGNLEYVAAGIVVVGVAALVVTVAVLLGDSRERTMTTVARIARHIPFLPEAGAVEFVGMLSDQLHEYRSSRSRVLIVIGWAAANWLLDAGALWILMLAFGVPIDPRRLLVAYGLACLVGLLPITPGGLGIIEGILIPALVGFGSPQSLAVLAVLTWRLVQYWLPMPLAIGAYLSLRTSTQRKREAREVAAV
jgi:hypothetical protein